MKILVVYYSRSGVTKKIAQEITAAAQADIEEINCTEKMSGIFGFIRGGREAATGKPAAVAPLKAAVEDYDMVVLGAPIWAGKLCSPAASFLNAYATKAKKLSVFITHGSSTNDFLPVTEETLKKAGVTAGAKLSLDSRAIKKGEYDITGFVNELTSENINPV